jgi:hypothetical protein
LWSDQALASAPDIASAENAELIIVPQQSNQKRNPLADPDSGCG